MSLYSIPYHFYGGKNIYRKTETYNSFSKKTFNLRETQYKKNYLMYKEIYRNMYYGN